MDERTFSGDLEGLLELDRGSLTLGTELAALGQWDSLAFVSFLAMADSKYGVKVAPAELRQCATVGDLMKLVNKQ